MPNHIVLASGAVVVVSAAVAAAIIAMSESPEFQRQAEDMRRRVTLAFNSFSEQINNLNPQNRQPRFNRPEDADGFMVSSRGAGAEPGVDADEETRRRQREELMYWNSQRLQNEKERDLSEKTPIEDTPKRLPASRGSSFDDFLKKDTSADTGAYVFNSGADTQTANSGLRHRGDGARGFAAAGAFANPFADENFVGDDEIEEPKPTPAQSSPIAPGRDEVMSDIYSATTRDLDEQTPLRVPESTPTLIDVEDSTPAATGTSATMDGDELAENEYMTAGQEDREAAYANIQAWAQNSSSAPAPGFYSPLPVTPSAPTSEPELISEPGDGQLTPTDSISLVGSGEDVANDARSSRADDLGVMSESEGIMTPASWSEVGSVISEYEAPMRAQ